MAAFAVLRDVNITLTPLPGRPTLAPALEVRNWTSGQLLTALVTRSTQDSVAELRIGDRLLQAASKLPLREGQSLTLRVLSTGPRPVLQVIEQPQGERPSALEVRNEAFRRTLPTQRPLPAVLEALDRYVRQPTQPGREVLQRAVQELLTTVPDRESLQQAMRLKQAIRNSGTLLEPKLRALLQHGTKLPPRDLKSALLQLAAVLRDARPEKTPRAPHATVTAGSVSKPLASAAAQTPTADAVTQTVAREPQRPTKMPPPATSERPSAPPTAPQSPPPLTTAALEAEVNGALARVQVQQLSNVPISDAPQNTWAIDVPVRGTHGFDTLQLIVEHDGSRQRDAERQWSITLSFNMDELGPISARLSLVDSRIDGAFWAERTQTRALIDTHLTVLNERLRAAGLEPGRLRLLSQSPVPERLKTLPRGLLSVEA